MSKIGKKPISIPSGVEVKWEKPVVKVKGPKGELSLELRDEVDLEISDSEVRVKKVADTKLARSLWGTYRSLINNMIIGVSQGFEKKLELVGVGYRAEVKGNTLVLQLGYSHPIEYPIPEGIEIKAERTSITVRGIDKQKVGQVAAEIRAFRPPEPYKGKGIRYEGEQVRRKAGKAAVGAR